MPRIILGHERERPRYPNLVAELAEELRHSRRFGQPLIREQRFPKTDVIRTTVIWDKWEPLHDEDRLATILEAYEEVEGDEFRNRVALAIGLTVPEAHEAGLLPVQVATALRASDPVTAEQCRDAMIEVGASLLLSPERPVLRFATVEEAEQCVRELVKRLPGSEPVWSITKDIARIGDFPM
jgi:hypothetical protein